MPSHSFITIVMGRQDLTTYQPILPLSLARDEPGHPVALPGGIQHWVGFTDTKISGSSGI
jgi:hypothetical protein